MRGLHPAIVLATLLPGAFASPAAAHDVPSNVTLNVYVKPEREQLRLIVRAPLESMQDMLFPTTGPGYLDLSAARSSGTFEDSAMLWVGENVELYEEDRRLPELVLEAVRISLPSDRSFESWDLALAHVTGAPLAVDTQIPWRQAMIDMLFAVPIDSQESNFSIRPLHGRLGMRVVTVLRFVPPGGSVRAFEFRGEPGLVRLDPRWHQAAGRFVGSGFFHILDGLDHLLFLACLVIPLRRLRELVMVVTSFTVAHSITLIASAYGLAPDALWFPSLVELLIAASIVTMAFENIIGAKTERRWMIAFGFGLVHGFGFSFALRDTLQFAGSHLLTSLLSFNLGVELSQLFVLVLLVPLLDLLYKHVVPERMGVILLSAIVAHTSWHWMSERAATLGQYAATWPFLNALPTAALPWIAPIVILTIVAWRVVRDQKRPVSVPAEDP